MLDEVKTSVNEYTNKVITPFSKVKNSFCNIMNAGASRVGCNGNDDGRVCKFIKVC